MRRAAAALCIAVAVLAACWTNSFSWFGYLRPGQCSWQSGTDFELLDLPAAQQRFDAALATNSPVGAATVACSYWPTSRTGTKALDESGLTAAATALAQSVRSQFGRIPTGGYSPGGVKSGHIAGSAHYEGRAIDFFFRPYSDPGQRAAGWQLAQWAVLHADQLGVNTVIFDDRIWTRNGSAAGWSSYQHPSGPTDNPILRHLDHVHVDVF